VVLFISALRVLSQSALDALAGHVAVLDEDGNILLVNRSWRQFADANEFLGASYGVGSSYLEVCDQATGECAEEAPQVAQGIRSVLSAQVDHYHQEYPCHSPNEKRWFQVRVTGFEESGQQHAVVVHENITTVKKVQELLRLSEARFRALTESSGSAVFVVQDDKLVFANPETERVTGYSAEELLQLNFAALIDPEFREVVLERKAARLRGEPVPARYELRIQAKNGAKRWLDFAGSVLEWEGRPAVLGSATDVTERRRLEDQLRQAQKMEAVGRLAGGIAHDFNNLLGVIIGYSELATMRLPEDETLRYNINQVMAASERAAALTRQLLTFSRKEILQPQVIDLNTVIQDIQKLVHRLVREDIRIESKLDPQLGRVLADVGQVEQVLMNLILNACDAMPKGGRLHIRTENRDLKEPASGRFARIDPGRYVGLTVADNGIGMDLETQERIFEPFFTTKEAGKGTGLGLATVYAIVKQNGGYINVYSELGVGSTFVILVPRVDREAAKGVEPMPTPESLQGSETVLLVEDEASLRKLAVAFLEQSGYRVLVAENAASALEAAALHGGIDVLVTDVILPGQSGKELASRLSQTCPNLKVLYVSGYTDDALAPHGILGPNVNFLQKPFARTDLLRKLRETLDKKN